MCEVTLEVDEDMDGPVYFYVEMKNYFQNHRIYSKSRDYNQLAGDDVSESDLTNCGDYTEINDLYFDLGEYPQNADARDLDEVMNPCGLIARSFMNDTFNFTTLPSLDLEEDDIAWQSDGDNVYSNTDDWKQKQWLNVEEGNAHSDWFKVWMRVAAFGDFRKLRYVIDDDIDKGDYTIQITSSELYLDYDVSDFDGEKHIFLSTTGAFAGKSFALGVIFIVTGGVAFVEAAFCLIMWISHRKSKASE